MRELLTQFGLINVEVKSLLADPASAILEIDRKVLAKQTDGTLPMEQFGGVPLAGNLIPWIDRDLGDGMSLEEWKELQIKTGRWQSMTPEQQARAFRRQVVEHITPEEIGKMATRANVKTVVLSHFLPATNPKDDYARLGEQVNKHFSGKVLVAKDLMEF